MTIKAKCVCSGCWADAQGDEDSYEGSIYWDGSSVYWNEDTQTHEADDGLNSSAFCGNCGGEGREMWLDLETGGQVFENIYEREYPRPAFVTPKRYAELRTAYHERAAKMRAAQQANHNAATRAELEAEALSAYVDV